MAPTTPASQITVTLDGHIPLERLVLNRVQTLTGRSRQSWLRSLLIQGFLLECRILKIDRESRLEVAPARAEARPVPPSAPYTLTVSSRFTGNTDPVKPAHKPNVEEIATTRTDGKPFAHLRRVIG